MVRHFLHSKLCLFLLLFSLASGVIFFKIIASYLFEESPENWYPYFTFTISQECAFDNACISMSGNSVGYRSITDPDSFESAFEINQFYFPLKETSKGETLFFRIKASDWQCEESGSQALGEKSVEPNREDPRKGFFYVCWPVEELPYLE